MQRIQRMATALLPVMGVFCLFYVIFTGHDALDLAILTPERWLESRYADPQAQIAQSTRIIAAFAMLSPVIAGLVAVFMAIYVLNLVRQGVLFDERIAQGFRVAGVATAVSGILGMAISWLRPTILSWHNQGGALAPDVFFHSDTAGLIVCGAMFWLVGWIMREAIRIADDNEGFV
ncbi:DUF2975 domain-containing protein [Roseinatronobacter monicus]|uniref:DUF2975 family protein n=1 Tax=Roseinatronobacter monicus TaxID=393481 RepID=A0A543K5U9_9RHOB|nr:DUF2975 domain-containing protein [Roseinatronobacter monicus]TQM90450.1 hypothetical protein BD293_3836 [Roseinatronobacter monicus]